MRARRGLLLAVVVTFMSLLGLTVPQAALRAATAAGPCDPPANPIVCENSKAGTPASTWDISGSGSSTIQGFTTDISADLGQTVTFKVKTPAKSYRLDIYRLGYYGGNGARAIASVSPSATLPQTQPACNNVTATGLVDCGNWATSASWTVPTSAVSGVYFAKLVRTDGTAGSSHVFFVVRDDSSHSSVFFQTSDTAWQAYNEYGGNSLYVGSPAGRAYKVSYNRPITTRGTTPEDFVFNGEYPMIRWLEANGYDVSYTSGIDTDRRGSLIKNHKAFMSVGHDEYWSGTQRANVEAARDAGVNLAFFSGNESFWKTRWENSADGSNTAYRTLVCYKETHANAKIDPNDPPTWTGSWRDARFSPPADGGRPENGMSGTIFMVNGPRNDAIKVPQSDGQMRFWRNTSEATLANGAVATLPTGTLGYEWDEDLDNGARPAGLIDLSTASYAVSPDFLLDNGSNYGAGTATHHLTLYRAPSGALVFGAGTVQWAYGLDSHHDYQAAPTDKNMQQATVNLFADMGVQPATLQTGLVAATASTDTVAPTATIAAPSAGDTVQAGTTVTVSGTASDSGGGTVGGVEVSTDSGTSWHPAAGRGAWSYSWRPANSGPVAIKARATDDSANIGAAASVAVTVSAHSCPCTIFGSATPSTPADPDTSANELGVKFKADTSGTITGLRFYKGAGNTGTHVGHLWNRTGTLLASATFTGETASGWQQVSFSSPVAVTAGTTYVASYHTDTGHYAEDDNFFATSSYDTAPLHALADGVDGPNGVYASGASAFPTLAFQAANYYVDVVYSAGGTTNTPPSVTAHTPGTGATSVAVGVAPTATFSESVQSINFTLQGPGTASVSAATTYNDATRTATLTPGANLAPSTTYTVTVSATDLAGLAMSAPVTWSFTTAATTNTPPSVTAHTPGTGATSVAVGVAPTATFSESVQSINFTLQGPGTASVSAATTYNDATRTATLTPGANLAPSTTYTATVSATDLAGLAMSAPVTWTFTTAGSQTSGCPCSLWGPTTVPGTLADPDNTSIEVGVKFSSDVAGSITGIRFYKASTNTGAHTGSLWTAGGTKLATATFTGETASGWQQVNFSTPVAVTANTTYVASYHTNTGHYSVDENYFSAGTDKAPLHALPNGSSGGNGVYRYGASAFPNSTYASSNYWVDVAFASTGG